jgi:DNA-binding NarL/FixJ family response regulator
VQLDASGTQGMQMNIDVLLVDDHKILREGLVALLKNAGDISVVAEASDGIEAVELTKKHSPDVVVMDLSLPLMGGIEATRQIVANNPECRVLVFSMFLDKNCLFESLEAGAKGYLVKDCASQELLVAIRTLRAEKPYFCAGAMQIMINGFTPGCINSTLTKREQEVLKLTAECYNTKEIAFELGVSTKMIEKHRKHVKDKLGVKNITQLITYAARIGLISIDVSSTSNGAESFAFCSAN